MKRLLKNILLISIILVGFISLYKINNIIGLINISNLFGPQYKTDDYETLKNNLSKDSANDEKAKWLLDNFDSLSNIERNLIGNDNDTIEFVYNYENNIKEFTYQVGPSKDYGRLTPYYTQWDNRWAYNALNDSNIGFSGCGPTSMAMILSRLNNDSSITPNVIAYDAHKYMGSNGISWKFFTDEAYKYNKNIENIELNEESMIQALEKGPLLVSVNRGYFTLKGHIIVIDSYSNNKFVINDPNSLKNSERMWNFDQLSNQIANIWLIY